MKLEVIASDELRRFGLPKFQTDGSAAIDLRALLNSSLSIGTTDEISSIEKDEGRVSSVTLNPGAQITLDSGLKIHINDRHYAGLILPRSSSGKKGLVLANGTGLIDSDYQGSLLLMVWNRSNLPIVITDGDRIAQYMVVPVVQFDTNFVDEFSGSSERGEGGFGSTGSD